MQRSLRLDAFEARCDQVGCLLRRHHAHVDFSPEDRRVELHIRAAFIGYGSQFLIDDLGDLRHLREEGIKLVASGNGDFVGGDNRCFAHAAWQIFLAPKSLQIPEPVWRGDFSDDLGVRHVVIVEEIFGLRSVDLQSGQAFMHMLDEVVGVIFAAGPLVEAERALLRNRLGGCSIEDRGALLR
jgi:hypothetical protein